MEYNTCQPLTILFHPGAVSDVKIFKELLKKLKRRKTMMNGDLIIADKGYYSYNKYQIGLLKYKIIPLIYPKSNTKKEKIINLFSYPLEVFKQKSRLKLIYQSLVRKFSFLYDNWKAYKPIRSKIEDFNKLFKNGVDYEKLQNFTYKSAKKTTYLSILLATLLVSKEKLDNQALQQLTEM